MPSDDLRGWNAALEEAERLFAPNGSRGDVTNDCP
jgi:hypothetical protein